MITIKRHEFHSREALDLALTNRVCSLLNQAIEKRDTASLVVSGGNTPIGLFQQLSQASIDWSKIYVTLADERWLPTDHAESNERLIRENLLKQHAAALQFIGLYSPAPSPEAAVAVVEQRFKQIALPFDLVILGMGEDGHTASLFPDCAERQQALAVDYRYKSIATYPQKAKHPRLSLALATLIQTRHLIVHFTGQSKRSVFENAISHAVDLPIIQVIAAYSEPCHLYWAN